MKSPLLACLALALVGCSDGSPALDTGVPPRTPLSDLTDGEATQMCEAFADYIGDLLPRGRLERVACTMAGVATEAVSGESGACEEVRDACLEDTSELDLDFELGELQCDEFDGSLFAECHDATVGDVEQCFTDIGRAIDRVFDEATCSRLAGDPEAAEELGAELDGLFEGEDAPESCRRLSEACPDANIFG